MTHTAEETKDLNRKFVQRLTQHFKDHGDVKHESEIETIVFSSFDNQRRIAFFRSLTDKVDSPTFQFLKITDFGLCPESAITLPRELEWMKNSVTDFEVRGDALQDTFFIKGKHYHKYFLFYSIEANFKFESSIAKGSCSIAFEFPGFAPKKNSDIEFEVNISSLALDESCSEVNKTAVRTELLRLINDYKLSQFVRYRLQAGSSAVVGRSTPGPDFEPFQLEAPI
jgi:hypothetical protein